MEAEAATCLEATASAVPTGTMIDLVGPNAASWLDLARNIALILIAPSLFVIGWMTDSAHRTSDLIHRISHPPIIDRTERLRIYNRSKTDDSVANPYDAGIDGAIQHDLLFDLGTALNYFEGVCSEITIWTISTRKVYKDGADVILGVHDSYLKWFTELTNIEPKEAFPNLCKVAKKAERWKEKKGQKAYTSLASRKPPPAK